MEVIEGFNTEPSEAVQLALYIRKSFLEYKRNTDKRVISPIKLQKSLYFLFAYWGQFIRNNKENKDSVEVDYSNYSEFLYDNRIEAWTYGPVVPDVFIADKNEWFDAYKIDGYLEGEENRIKKEFIDNLLIQLFDIDDFGLVRLSHEDECWKRHYVESDAKHNREIPKEEIIDEYYSK